eukprot:GHVL01044834.1.p1 GENE.GHVL01044834.1~~GHVL01044834.1.p1  ORF type:complete len:528 (+),score=89.59 GHVL01044834.1:988-2571(+)
MKDLYRELDESHTGSADRRDLARILAASGLFSVLLPKEAESIYRQISEPTEDGSGHIITNASLIRGFRLDSAICIGEAAYRLKNEFGDIGKAFRNSQSINMELFQSVLTHVGFRRPESARLFGDLNRTATILQLGLMLNREPEKGQQILKKIRAAVTRQNLAMPVRMTKTLQQLMEVNSKFEQRITKAKLNANEQVSVLAEGIYVSLRTKLDFQPIEIDSKDESLDICPTPDEDSKDAPQESVIEKIECFLKEFKPSPTVEKPQEPTSAALIMKWGSGEDAEREEILVRQRGDFGDYHSESANRSLSPVVHRRSLHIDDVTRRQIEEAERERRNKWPNIIDHERSVSPSEVETVRKFSQLRGDLRRMSVKYNTQTDEKTKNDFSKSNNKHNHHSESRRRDSKETRRDSVDSKQYSRKPTDLSKDSYHHIKKNKDEFNRQGSRSYKHDSLPHEKHSTRPRRDSTDQRKDEKHPDARVVVADVVVLNQTDQSSNILTVQLEHQTVVTMKEKTVAQLVATLEIDETVNMS